MLDAWYPGESNGTALASVLFGNTDPSGHLPVTFPTDLSQVPASTPQQFPGVNGQVDYSEGIDIGYRHYDATGETPLFPFGFGLSYTSFKYIHLKITPDSVRTRASNPGATAASATGSRRTRSPSRRRSPTRARSPAPTSRSCTWVTRQWPASRRDSSRALTA